MSERVSGTESKRKTSPGWGDSDAHLRHRLWFRFWRGWRKAMVALVVLVAVAWGTRPALEVHVTAVRAYALVEGLLGEQRDFSKIEDPVSRKHAETGDHRGQESLIRALIAHSYENSILWSTNSLDDEFNGFTTVGAFGHVWVLD